MKLYPSLLVCALLLPSCTHGDSPSEELASVATSALQRGPARLQFGTSTCDAEHVGNTTFTMEATPDLVLHATLRDTTYNGKTASIRATDPDGFVVWNAPHRLKGKQVDAVVPVLRTRFARSRKTGAYAFSVVAPDQTVLAAGTATFVSDPTAGPTSTPTLPIAGGQ